MRLQIDPPKPWGRRHVVPGGAEVTGVSVVAVSPRSQHPSMAPCPAGTPGEPPAIPHMPALNSAQRGAALAVCATPDGCRGLLLCMSCAETPDTGNLETTTVASEPPLQAAKVGTTAPASAGTGLGEVLEVGMSDETEEWRFRLGAAGGNIIKPCWREREA